MNVSVIVCTFNGEKYIVEQLNSILDQSIQPDEIIVVDDNSTDNTYELIKSCYLDNPKIKIYKNDINKGVVKNFEKALLISKGKYIFFSDQDDIWMRNKIEEVLKAFKYYDADMVCHDALIVDKHLKILNNSLHKKVGLTFRENKLQQFDSLLYNNKITGCCMAINNKLKNKVIPFSKNVLHDQWISLIAIQEGNIFCIDDKLVLYRQHDNNVVGIKKTKKSFDNIYQIYKQQYLFANELDTIIKDLKLSVESKKFLDFWSQRYDFVKNNLTIRKFIKIIISDLNCSNYNKFYNGKKGAIIDIVLIVHRWIKYGN